MYAFPEGNWAWGGANGKKRTGRKKRTGKSERDEEGKGGAKKNSAFPEGTKKANEDTHTHTHTHTHTRTHTHTHTHARAEMENTT